MEMLCPACLGTMVTSDGREAICTLDGKRYQILYTRHPVVAGVPVGAAAEMPPALPTTEASEADGDVYNLTPDQAVSPLDQLAAVRAPIPAATATYAMPAGVVCRTHPEMAAIAYCRNCASPVCATCDFAYPGGIHLCPTCAAKPPDKIGPKRRNMLIAAYVLAAVATLGIVLVIFMVAHTSAAMRHEDATTVGLVTIFLVFIPTLIGAGLAGGSMDKRLGNPPVVWGAIVWNGLLVLLLVLAVIKGMMR